MPATDHHRGSPGPFNSFSRSILTTRREQVHSIDGDSCHEDVELFQKNVTERFLALSNSSTGSDGDDVLLSISWIRKLLDVFLRCQEDFMVLLFDNKSQLSKSPADRAVADFLDRVVKALDVCNAVRDGVEQIKQWRKLVDIVLVALDSERGDRSLGEGQFRRAKKALIDLAIGMLDDKESSFTHRNRSFGRSTVDKNHRSIGHLRSLSWSVSRSWSASKQLQAIGSNLVAPRGGDIVSSNGLVVAAYTMNSILLFVMWTLVAAIPCQDRGLQVHFNIPRHFAWAGPILTLHEQIFEESKKRDRKNTCGLLREIHLIEKYGRHLSELVDSVQFPLTEQKEAEVRNAVAELSQVYETLKDGLDPLELQVREVFHRIVRSRTEGLGLGKALGE